METEKVEIKGEDAEILPVQHNPPKSRRRGRRSLGLPEARRSARRRWIGSENQGLHHLSDRYRDHPDIRSDGSQSVTISFSDGEMTVSGWPSLADALRPAEPRQ